MKLSRIWAVLGLSCLIFGCSKSSGKNKKNGNGEDKPNASESPNSPEEALKKLSPFHLKQVEDWEANIVKSCSSNSIFTESDKHSPEISGKKSISQRQGIDAEVFLKSNANSAIVFQGERAALIDSYTSNGGVSRETTNFSSDINGKKYELSAMTLREGSKCSLYLFEQKVFETEVVASLNIGSVVGETLNKKIESKTVSKITSVGNLGLGELYSPGLVDFINLVFKPTADDRTFVAKKLGIPTELAESLITIDQSKDSDLSFRMSGEASALWNSINTKSIVANSAVLKKNFDLGKQTKTFEIRTGVPTFTFGKVTNSADQGTFKIDLNINLEKSDDKVVYSLETAGQTSFIPFDRIEASQCIESRVLGYLLPQDETNRGNLITPSVSLALDPCHIFYNNDLYKFAMVSGIFKALIPHVFQGVKPTRLFTYSGWDVVFSELALLSLEQGKDILGDLDPNHLTRVVGLSSAILDKMVRILPDFSNLNADKKLLYSMGISWALSGYVPAEAMIEDTFSTLDHVMVPFKMSTLEAIRCLARNPEGCDGSREFAKSINDDYKLKAVATLSISRELNYTTFQKLFDSILQMRPSLQAIDSTFGNLTEVKKVISQFSNIAKIKGQLVENSMSWLANNEVKIEDLSNIYQAFDNTVDVFPNSAQVLLDKSARSLKDASDSILYASQLTQDMKNLAVSIRNLAKDVGLEQSGVSFFNSILQDRPSMDQLQKLQTAWQASSGYTNEEAVRLSKVPERLSENDTRRKEVIKIAISDLWTANHYSWLTSIADVANLKKDCSKAGPGVSSIIYCMDFTYSQIRQSEGSFFNPKYGSRYGVLASSYASWVRSVLKNEDISFLLGSELTDRFFGFREPIWSKCVQGVFDQKSTLLGQQISQILNEKVKIKQWDLKDVIEKNLENCSQ